MNIRKAVLSDANGIAKVHVDSWKTTYKHIVPDEFLNQLTYEKREPSWKKGISNGGVFVAENDEGKIIGFSSGGKERSEKYKDFDGELYAIYILKEYQGRGLGSLLIEPIIVALKNLKLHSMLVIVLEDNGSKYFYEKLGAKKIDTDEIEISGKKLNELVYGWHDLKAIQIK